VEGQTITVSMLFKWYRTDFGSSDAELVNWIKSHASVSLKEKLAGVRLPVLAYAAYDWSLN
jgi:hypothetical protein